MRQKRFKNGMDLPDRDLPDRDLWCVHDKSGNSVSHYTSTFRLSDLQDGFFRVEGAFQKIFCKLAIQSSYCCWCNGKRRARVGRASRMSRTAKLETGSLHYLFYVIMTAQLEEQLLSPLQLRLGKQASSMDIVVDLV